MYYPDEVIREVGVKSDIVDVISRYVELQKKGADYFDLYPFHSKKSPSFSVPSGKQMYYCFGCGAGGNVITFLMEYENCTFQEALSSLAGRAGVNLPKMGYSREAREQVNLRARLLEANKLAANYFYYQMKQSQDKTAYDYFHLKGGLADEIIVHSGLGYFNKTSDGLCRYLKGKEYGDSFLRDIGLVTLEEQDGRDKFWSRVIFPIMDVNNRVIGFGSRVVGDEELEYLDSPETKFFDKNHNLYGLNYARLSREGYLLIYEGYLDIISLHQASFTSAVASLGTAFTSQHINVLKRYTDQVILTYDSDGVRVKAALKTIPILKEVGMSIKVLNMKPYKDPDEFTRNMGAEALRQRVRGARNSFLFRVDVLQRGYEMDNPEQKTRFYQETARELLQFGEALERENHLQAVAGGQMIPTEELRGLVSRMGMSMGLKVGENLNHSDRMVSQETQEGESDGSGLSDSRKPRRPDKEDGVRRSQKLLLTWLIETPALFEKMEDIITADDFVENLYHRMAQMVFDGHREGSLSPAAIFSRFINDEDQHKGVVTLFNANLKEPLDSEGRKKTFSETVMKVRKNSLDVASHNAKDITQLQGTIRQQTALKQLYISLD